MAVDTINESELALLENLPRQQIRGGVLSGQREIARRSGLSLGLTNALLKRFAQKGWVTVRRINARSLMYALTAEGTAEVARRTLGYFRRTARNVAFYREVLERFLRERMRQGLRRVILDSPSDLDFLVEYICLKLSIEIAYCTALEGNPGPGDLVIVLSPDTGHEAERGAGCRSLCTGTSGCEVVELEKILASEIEADTGEDIL